MVYRALETEEGFESPRLGTVRSVTPIQVQGIPDEVQVLNVRFYYRRNELVMARHV